MDALIVDRESIINEEHLRLLSIGNYIAGGFHIAFASLFIFHFVFLIVIASHPHMFPPTTPDRNSPPEALLHIFAGLIGAFILSGWAFGALTIYAGRCIKARSRRTFCLVMAAINILSIPFGTIVGVCGIMVLCRSGVRRLYPV